jgi:hypothetical protein
MDQSAMACNSSIRPKVFLDTSVLLKGFASHLNDQELPFYLTDPCAQRYTFEKCIFEAYMTFRGIGGKKPDEGKGDWARRFLQAEDDPASVGKLISKYHDGSRDMGHFWINQILEAEAGLEDMEENIRALVGRDQQEEAFERLRKLRELSVERRKFEALCWEYNDFLVSQSVTELAYAWVFNIEDFYSDPNSAHSTGPNCLDGFVRDTTIPSEDFEIVYAALRISADIFVTDDSRLRTCAMSLGLNLPLSPSAFCSSIEYLQRVAEWRDARAG